MGWPSVVSLKTDYYRQRCPDSQFGVSMHWYWMYGLTTAWFGHHRSYSECQTCSIHGYLCHRFTWGSLWSVSQSPAKPIRRSTAGSMRQRLEQQLVAQRHLYWRPWSHVSTRRWHSWSCRWGRAAAWRQDKQGSSWDSFAWCKSQGRLGVTCAHAHTRRSIRWAWWQCLADTRCRKSWRWRTMAFSQDRAQRFIAPAISSFRIRRWTWQSRWWGR